MAKRSTDSLSALSEVSDLFSDEPQQANEIAALLKESTPLLGAEKRLTEIKLRLKELLACSPAVRHGKQCCIVRYQSGKRTLKPELLIENGVTPEQISASTVEGAGYYICELPVIE